MRFFLLKQSRFCDWLITLCYEDENVHQVKLLFEELNYFGVIARLFRKIGGHSSRFVLHILLFLKTFQYKND